KIRHAQERLQFAGKGQPPAGLMVKQRLFTQTIAGEKQRTVPLVPDGEREHAVKRFDATRPHLLIEMQDDFGVATGSELMSAPDQIGFEFEVVVDLAIEDDGQ